VSPETRPLEETLATLGALDAQVMVRFGSALPLASYAVAVPVTDSPTTMEFAGTTTTKLATPAVLVVVLGAVPGDEGWQAASRMANARSERRMVPKVEENRGVWGAGFVPRPQRHVPPRYDIIDPRPRFHPPFRMTLRSHQDQQFMTAALEAARVAGAAGEVPVGAVVTRAGAIVATAANAMVAARDATAHAEVLAIRAAQRVLGEPRLAGCTLYVTLEPCAMCAGAIVLARPDRVVFGAWDGKAGMVGSVGDLLRHPRLNHRPEVAGGVLEGKCAALLREWFAVHRAVV
jgi:tRNA(adenine34) deaminase